MRISINIIASDVEVSSDLIPLEVFDDMSLESVKSFIEDEIRIPPQAQTFIHNNQKVTHTAQSLAELGINEGDVLNLMIRTKQSNQSDRQQASIRGQATVAASQHRGAGAPDAETIRLQALGDPRLLEQIRSRDSALANAVNNAENFQQLWNERMDLNRRQQREKEEMMALLDADPFNVEAQTKIEEIIRQERVMENMQLAMEENPESFGRVVMLYIDVLVNNTPIKAFVDSGAQSTIMSPDAAEKCGIMRLIDKRFGGMARGVGTAKILGRVHHADIQVGQYNLASSFTVMEGKGVDLLLGLDMLKKHQMCIDLKDNVLKIQDENIPFLGEGEIPKEIEELADVEPKVEGPGGTQIGTSTGLVEPKTGTTTSPPITTSSSGIRIHPSGSAGNIVSGQGTIQPPQAPSSSLNQSGPITEASIAQVCELGFSREEAIVALEQANGNVEIAIGLLL